MARGSSRGSQMGNWDGNLNGGSYHIGLKRTLRSEKGQCPSPSATAFQLRLEDSLGDKPGKLRVGLSCVQKGRNQVARAGSAGTCL